MLAQHLGSTRKVVFFTLAAALCLAFSPARAQEAISTPILHSAPNFRDLAGISARHGGTGYVNPTDHGGVMRTGVFFRTDELAYLSPHDSGIITSLGVGRDIDLRTPFEINNSPDRVPPGIIYTNVNIYGVKKPVPDPPFTVSHAAAAQFMQQGYREFVTDAVQREGLRTVLLTLAHDDFPVMYHCSGGKDRTGWTSLLLQSIAGVSPDTIRTDYLATNSYTADLIAISRAAILANTPGANPATIDALLGVEASYLEAGLDQVTATYGSLYAYLTEGLGLTQADIYVLRGKMVYYATLPGQAGLSGNAAAGAALLRNLQDSPLSGHYTSYNYYLQAAVDAGALGGVETRAGGQVHADAAAFLLRQPSRVDAAIRPFTQGADLAPGQTRVWLAGLGGLAETEGHDGIAESKESTAGSLIGVTHRLGDRASLSAGLGYAWGEVKSADATATPNTLLATLGGRYGFAALDAGLFLEGRVDAGWVHYRSDRDLGLGLGTASGKTDGAVYSGQVRLGDVIGLAPFTLTPQVGARVTGLNLGSFDENGSELALDVDSLDETYPSLLAELEAALAPQELGSWTLTPVATLGYERILGDPQIETSGTLYGFSVSQQSAYDSRNLFTAGLSLAATHGGLSLTGMVAGVMGDDAQTTGINGQLSVAYNF
ncbi:MAG: tyrosine-protein phosphatase [Deltaproteobacteria bacterium]|nr:tyrosine-protein phosphatase [Deltaproteobacteria bacterium]